MINYNTWYEAVDVLDGTYTFYNYFWDLGSEVGMLSIEYDYENKLIGSIDYYTGENNDFEKGYMDIYDFKKADIKKYEKIMIKKVFNYFEISW